MQVFDLTRLRTVKPPKNPNRRARKLKAKTHYTEFGSAHNIVSNEETGFVYAVGSNTCKGGLHMVNVSDPKNPTFAGCYSGDNYTHDAQCVVYRGPDTRYQGREICFCYNEDTLTIVDVEDKESVTMLSRVSYNDSLYTHQVIQ